jgi:hypothetical protein
MGAVALSVVAGLVVAAIGFLGRQLVWPVIRRASLRRHHRRECDALFCSLEEDLTVTIDRLTAASLAERSTNEEGTERTFYRFGSDRGRRPVPELPLLRRGSLDAVRERCTDCLGTLAGLVDDAIGAADRYEAIDRDRFRDAWRASMNPVMERMVVGDPGHQTNRSNMKVVVDVDKDLSHTRAVLIALRDAYTAHHHETRPQ